MSTFDLLVQRVIEESVTPDRELDVSAVVDLVDAPDEGACLSIAAVGELLGLSAHTLRYYEREGLVRVGRDELGHRSYDADTVRRLIFLSRMRISGMGIDALRRYVALVEEGEHTVPQRLEMLQAHRASILDRLRELQLSLAATDHKIGAYGGRAGS